MYEDPNLSNLYDQLNMISAQNITGNRTGGGTGGGSMPPEVDPMSTNPFVEMNLNPYLTQNVNSFMGGGRMPNSYNYNMGGSYQKQADEIIGMKQLMNIAMGANATPMGANVPMAAKGGSFKPHMMYSPKTGKGYKANELQDHLDMKEKGYDHRKRNPDNYPKAADGMEMPMSGMSSPADANNTRESMLFELLKNVSLPSGGIDFSQLPMAPTTGGFNPKVDPNNNTMMPSAAKGMKMKRKRYTQGGRF